MMAPGCLEASLQTGRTEYSYEVVEKQAGFDTSGSRSLDLEKVPEGTG